jgi:hypothetical protein
VVEVPWRIRANTPPAATRCLSAYNFLVLPKTSVPKAGPKVYAGRFTLPASVVFWETIAICIFDNILAFWFDVRLSYLRALNCSGVRDDVSNRHDSFAGDARDSFRSLFSGCLRTIHRDERARDCFSGCRRSSSTPDAAMQFVAHSVASVTCLFNDCHPGSSRVRRS